MIVLGSTLRERARLGMYLWAARIRIEMLAPRLPATPRTARVLPIERRQHRSCVGKFRYLASPDILCDRSSSNRSSPHQPYGGDELPGFFWNRRMRCELSPRGRLRRVSGRRWLTNMSAPVAITRRAPNTVGRNRINDLKISISSSSSACAAVECPPTERGAKFSAKHGAAALPSRGRFLNRARNAI